MLAIAAARLGWGPVVACDHEAGALEAAAANAEANGVEIELVRANLRAEPPPPAPTVAANITAPVLLAIAERLDARAAQADLLRPARAGGRRGRGRVRAATGSSSAAAAPTATGTLCFWR